MRFYSKVFLALILALGLVACPDDEKKDEDKVTLKFADLADFAKGASPADFSVEIHKGDEVDKESKLSVKVEIACGEAKGSKSSTAAKGVANFSASDFSGITWTGLAEDVKCTATATGEGAEKATKEFKVTEAAETTPPPGPGGDEEITIAVTDIGSVTVSHAEASQMIKLVAKDNDNCDAALVLWNADNTVTVATAATGLPGNSEGVWIVDDASGCKLTVGTGADAKEDDLSDYDSRPQVVSGADSNATSIVLTFIGNHGLTATTNVNIAVHGDNNFTAVKGEMLVSAITSNDLTFTGLTGVAADTAYTVWIKHEKGIERETTDT